MELPVGSAPEPLAFPHFPSRLHAVVWRNWQLVAPAKLAEVVGATKEQITRLAESMGLPPAGHVPPDLIRRAYITIIRRNWHLLPYEQLLTLLDMTPEQLAFALREDDFLFIKLGNLKPKMCSGHVRGAGPSGSQACRGRSSSSSRAGSARSSDRAVSRDSLSWIGCRACLGEFRPPARREAEGPRFLSSYFGTFGDPLADGAADSFPEGLLGAPGELRSQWRLASCRAPSARSRRAGLPGIRPGLGTHGWPTFAGWSNGPQRFGIDVYLYMNEPRAMPVGLLRQKAGPGWRARGRSSDALHELSGRAETG